MACNYKVSTIHIILLVLLLNCTNCQQSTNDKDVVRLNAGLLLNYKGTTPIVSANWKHVAIIELPDKIQTEVFNMSKYVNITPEFRSVDDGQYCQRVRRHDFVIVNGGLPCSKYRPQLELLLEISEELQIELNSLLDNVYALVPARPGQRQLKRGLGSFLGQGISYIFGLATSEEVKLLQLTQQQSISKSNEELKAVKRFSKDLASYASQTNANIANMMNKIKQSALNQLQLYEQARHNDEREKAYEHNITLKLWRLTYHGFQIKTHYMALLEAVEDMISGIISPTLITPSAVKQLYDGITDHLQGTSFRMAFPQIDWFYKNVEFVALRENTTLFISFRIPLTTFEEKFDVYQITTVPLQTHDGDGHMTRLKNMPEVIAVSQDRQFYVEMTLLELMDFRLHTRGLHRPIVQKLTRESCLGAILESNIENTGKYCEYTFEVQGRKSAITFLHQSKVLITHTNLTVVCDDGTKTNVNCTSCVYQIPPNCIAFNEQYHIAALQNAEQNNQNTSQLGHTVNMVWLQRILGESKKKFLKDLDMSQLLSEQIQITNLPSLKTLNDSLNEMFVSAENNKMSLDVAARALQDDSRVILDLEDAVFFGSLIKTDPWGDPIGILVIISTILNGLLIAYTVFATIHMRKLTITVMLLTEHIKMAKADIYIDFLEIAEQTRRNATSKPQHFHFILREHSAAVTSAILASIVIGYLLYRCYMQTRIKTKRWELAFTLQFSTLNDFLIVPLKVLSGLPEDYVLEATQFITNIKVLNYWPKRLLIEWPTAKLRNILTNEIQNFDSETFPIGLWQAYKLQRILETNKYVCLPTLLDRNSLHRLTTHPFQSDVTCTNAEQPNV